MSRLWLAPPIQLGDEELYFLTRGNMNEDGEVANTTDGSMKVFRSEVALGRLRTDGAVSIDGSYGKVANLTTKPLIFSGSRLYYSGQCSCHPNASMCPCFWGGSSYVI